MSVIDGKAWREALMVFGRMSGWVAGPILLALVIGRRIDANMGTGHRAFFIGIGIGFFVSLVGIYIESRKYLRAIERRDAQKKIEANNTINGNSTPDHN